jgi:4-nitrophenyl phosphatase
MAEPVVAPTGGEAKSVGNLILDLDGVIYLGSEPIAGADEALHRLAGAGYRIIPVTNNATRSPDEVVRHIEDAVGYRPNPALVVTSGLATAHLLRGRLSRVFIVGEAGLTRTFSEEGFTISAWEDAEAVVVGLHRGLRYDDLRDAVLAIQRGAVLAATNLDPTYPTPEGLWPGGGAIAAAIATAAGVEPEVGGKPAVPTRQLVKQRLGPGPVWVVGDRADTDLAMGAVEGWNRALVLTGATTSADGIPPEEQPELVIASIADLPAALLGS